MKINEEKPQGLKTKKIKQNTIRNHRSGLYAPLKLKTWVYTQHVYLYTL